MQTFLLHASLLRVGESGKLRLTNDTTTLEFAVTQYLSAHGLALNSMGDQFKAVRGGSPGSGFLLPCSLRGPEARAQACSLGCGSTTALLLGVARLCAAFRPLLFRELSSLGDSTQTGDVPTLILLHHVLARGGLALPHQVRGWSETEYVRWLNEHQEDERIRLVEEVVQRERAQREPATSAGGEDADPPAAAVALEIATKILARGPSSSSSGGASGASSSAAAAAAAAGR